MARRPSPIITGIVDTTGDDSDVADVPGSNSGDGNAASIIIDPTTLGPDFGDVGGSGDSGGSAAGSAQPKRRGRKPGSVNRAKGAALDINGLGEILVGFHGLLAAVTRVEELELSQDEANKLAKATTMVARHYNVEVAAKTTDWIHLAMVAGGVYAPRLMAARLRMSMEKMERRSTQRPVQPVATPNATAAPATVFGSEAPELGQVDAWGFPIDPSQIQ